MTLPDYRPLSEFRACLPGAERAKRLAPSTLTRWIGKGVKGVSGEVVKLRAVRVGGRWLTTREWFEQFTNELSGTSDGTAVRSPAEMRHAADVAGRELAALGA